MTIYTIDRTSNSRRKDVEDWLVGLDLVSSALREAIVTAWVSMWASSDYQRLEDMPVTAGLDYPLMSHVNEVTRAGLDLAKRAQADWGIEIENDLLVPILILHDVDKPLIYVREGESIISSKLAAELPHGVVGAMMLRELGLSHEIVSTIATHSPKMPFHGQGHAAYLLYYADLFAIDHAMMSAGKRPYYQRHVGS